MSIYGSMLPHLPLPRLLPARPPRRFPPLPATRCPPPRPPLPAPPSAAACCPACRRPPPCSLPPATLLTAAHCPPPATTRHPVYCPAVTLLRALRPDIGGWVTLSPRYWAGVPSDWGPGSLLGGSR